MTLFDRHREEQLKKEAPLAARMRPRAFAEFVGQEHLVGEERVLRDGDTLTYGRIVIEVRASAAKAQAWPRAAAREAAAGSKRKPDPVPDPVQRARAREEKWYDVEVSSTTSRSSSTRER